MSSSGGSDLTWSGGHSCTSCCSWVDMRRCMSAWEYRWNRVRGETRRSRRVTVTQQRDRGLTATSLSRLSLPRIELVACPADMGKTYDRHLGTAMLTQEYDSRVRQWPSHLGHDGGHQEVIQQLIVRHPVSHRWGWGGRAIGLGLKSGSSWVRVRLGERDGGRVGSGSATELPLIRYYPSAHRVLQSRIRNTVGYSRVQARVRVSQGLQW